MVFVYRKKAFTLIELLVVIAIIGLIASVVLVNLQGVRGQARLATAQQFHGQIIHALGAYAVGIWRLEESTGSALDTSGYGNNGTVIGVTRVANCNTGLGGCFEFDAGDSIQILASPQLNVGSGGQFSLAAWFNTNSTSQQPIIEWNSGSIYGVHMWINVSGWPGTGANIRDTGGTSHVISFTPNPSPNEWHHLVVTYDRTTGNAGVYLDGVLKKNQNLSSFTPQTSYDLYIGRRPSGGPPLSFSGKIDEVYIFDRAISSAQVGQLYAEGLQRHGLAQKSNE